MDNHTISNQILPFLPESFAAGMSAFFLREDVTEIRMRIFLPLLIKTLSREYFLTDTWKISGSAEGAHRVTPEEMKVTFQKVSRYSVYAYKEELGEGFITLKGGHRVGLCGKAYHDGEGRRQLKEISSMNFRIARQITGCSDMVAPYLIENGRFCDTLLISPPGHGKTTFLRDLIRNLSDGGPVWPGMTVAVADERSEIGSRTGGGDGFYLGIRTDLLDHCPKADGMLMLLRTMGPQVVAADEIGSREDMDAIKYIKNCGCGLLLTIHGGGLDDIMNRPFLGEYLRAHPFGRYLVIRADGRGGRKLALYDSLGSLIRKL